MTTSNYILDRTASGESTWKAVDIDSLMDFAINETGDSFSVGSQGVRTANATHVDMIKTIITLRMSDNGQLNGANWRVGVSGALVLKMIKRSDGDTVSVTKYTATLASCVITSSRSGVPHAGASTVEVTLEATNATGVSPIIYS